MSQHPPIFFYVSGALMSVHAIPGLTQEMDDPASARYYGGEHFVCESLPLQAARTIAHALGGLFREPPGPKLLALPVEHGFTCEKAPHVGTGHLHAEDDDRPYDVDGCKYCGRCHVAL